VVASNLGIDAYFEGRWTEAVAWYERGREASERAGDVVQMATAINNLGEVESDRGHLADAKRRFESARRIWSEAPFPIGVALATSNLGRVAVRGGDLAVAKDLLDRAREDFLRIGAESYVIETDVRELERLVAAGDPGAAVALAEEIARRCHRAGGLPLQMLPADRARAYALAQRDEWEPALSVLEEVADRARALGATFELALTLEALHRVAEGMADPRSESFLDAAGALFGELGVTSTPANPLQRHPVPA
jgi:tetratricopeptide (TPR) repeat protein